MLYLHICRFSYRSWSSPRSSFLGYSCISSLVSASQTLSVLQCWSLLVCGTRSYWRCPVEQKGSGLRDYIILRISQYIPPLLSPSWLDSLGPWAGCYQCLHPLSRSHHLPHLVSHCHCLDTLPPSLWACHSGRSLCSLHHTTTFPSQAERRLVRTTHATSYQLLPTGL